MMSYVKISVFYASLVYNLFFHSIRFSFFFLNLNFYFMKTANVPVYGIFMVYITVCLKIDYTLRCLECIGSASS